jgi:hypothetical protein
MGPRWRRCLWTDGFFVARDVYGELMPNDFNKLKYDLMLRLEDYKTSWTYENEVEGYGLPSPYNEGSGWHQEVITMIFEDLDYHPSRATWKGKWCGMELFVLIQKWLI